MGRSLAKCKAKSVLQLTTFLNSENIDTLYRSIIEPYFSYCCLVWDSIGYTLGNSLQRLQNRAARIVTGAAKSKPSGEGF